MTKKSKKKKEKLEFVPIDLGQWIKVYKSELRKKYK